MELKKNASIGGVKVNSSTNKSQCLVRGDEPPGSNETDGSQPENRHLNSINIASN